MAFVPRREKNRRAFTTPKGLEVLKKATESALFSNLKKNNATLGDAFSAVSDYPTRREDLAQRPAENGKG
jgi:hypothetical protein